MKTARIVETAVILAMLVACAPAPEESSKPNIVIFLADDLGYADVGFHGGEIATPNLDQLAASGARLEQFYVQPACSPTRAALLTGRYPIRYGLQAGVVFPWSSFGLPLEERTLAQALKEAGYATAISGKWHLGHARRDYLPTRRGFDHQYGHYNGAIDDYFTHQRDGGHDWHRDDEPVYEDGYSTFLLADEAVRLIRRHDGSKPLFLYVPFNAAHGPYQAPPGYTKPYAHLPEPRRTYAGVVAAMDEAIGRVLGALDEKQMRRNTLILFSSDNGGPKPGQVTRNDPFRGGKATLYEGGVRVVALAVWEGRIPPDTIVDVPLHVVDWYPTVLGLAGASLAQALPLDGRDAWPAIAEGSPSPHEEILLNAAPGGGAIRVGRWKLIVHGEGADAEEEPASVEPRRPRGRSGRKAVELFDLDQDPREQANVASKHPDEVARLQARYEELLAQSVPPLSTPRPADYRPPKVWGQTP